MNTTTRLADSSRRDFLRQSAALGGAFLLGAFVPMGQRAFAAEGPGQGVIDPNLFVRIGADNTVTIICKKFEMGQGVSTGAATLIAEELEADWAAMRYEFAPNNAKVYNNLVFGPVMATGGTTSTLEMWTQMRQIGAATRTMLVSAAAAQWGVPAGEIRVARGVVSHASGKRASFGELAPAAMKVAVPDPKTLKLKEPAQWTLIGTRLPRLDSVAKTTGTAMFALDMRRPGMLTAMVRRPDRFGATVASFDATEARKIPGVVDVVQVPSGIAVLARDTWSAMRGREALKVSWDDSRAETRSSEQIFDEYRRLSNRPGMKALERGGGADLAHAAKVVEAEFRFPYLAHAPMEPLNCTLELTPTGAEFWSGSQLQSLDEYALFSVLGLKPEQVKIHTMLGGGSFGRRGNPTPDAAIEVAHIVKAINGRAPVHLVWTREDDLHGGYYRPMTLHSVKAGLDAQGHIVGWQHRVVSKSIFSNTPFAQMSIKDGIDDSTVEGIRDTPYAIDNLYIDVHHPTSPVPVLWWRSVGHSHTAQVMETMVDSLAHAAGKDPVQFRLGLLAKDPRAMAVLQLAAQQGGWGGKLPRGQGRGVAYHHSFGTRVATVAEVAVSGSVLSVRRIVCAVDCGVAVNPDVVVAQVEGAVGFALSSVLRNEITLKDGRVEQNNYDDYNPTRIPEMPKVEVHLVKSAEAPTGIGEPGVPPLAPAIGNAVFAATGRRLLSLPYRL